MGIFHPNSDRSNRFTPRLERLEDRQLCTIFIIPTGPRTPIRTGGAAALVGSVLLVVTNHPGANQAVIQDDGAGDVTVEWNGHTPPTFHGVTQIVLDGKGRRNSFTYFLTGNVTSPHEVDVLLHGTNSTFIPNPGGFSTSGLLFQIETAPPPANLAKGP